MIFQTQKIEVLSRKNQEMIDITEQVDSIVKASGVSEGMVFVMTMHTSSGLLVTEGLECLERDVIAHLERLAPKQPPAGEYGYWHNRYLDIDGRLGFNAGDHLKSILGGVNCFFPITEGRMLRGSRQRIYFMEYDGPLARGVVVHVRGNPRV